MLGDLRVCRPYVVSWWEKAGAETKCSQECSKTPCVMVCIPVKLGGSFNSKCSANQFEVEKTFPLLTALCSRVKNKALV